LDLAKALLNHALHLRLAASQQQESIFSACIRAAIANVYEVQHEWDVAEKNYDEALEIAASVTGSWISKEASWIATCKAWILYTQLKDSECATFCSKLLDHLKGLYGDEVNINIANTQFIWASVLTDQGDIIKAIPLLKQAELSYQKLNAQGRLVSTKNRLAQIYYNEARYSEALQLYKSSIKETVAIYKTTRNIEFAFVLGSMANIYLTLGQYRKAYVYDRESLNMEMAIRGTAGSSDTATGILNISNTVLLLGDVDGSLKLIEDAERILTRLNMTETRTMASAFYRKGSAYYLDGMYLNSPEHYSKALDCCSKSIALYTKTLENQNSPYFFAPLRLQGSIKRHQNRFHESRTDLELCLKREVEYYQSRQVDRVATTLVEIGALCRAEGKLEEALSHFLEARCTFEYVFGDRGNDLKAKLSHELGLLYTDMGKLAEARVELESAAAMLLCLFGDKNHPHLKLVNKDIGNL
jgi:tetratricopeptide (TPR) repeat protein